MTLTEFLLARIAEDEDLAKAARVEDVWPSYPWGIDETERALQAAYTPGRVLAECGAKRRIVVEFTSAVDWSQDADCPMPDLYRARAGTILDVLRLLALPYTDHHDYRPEWKL